MAGSWSYLLADLLTNTIMAEVPLSGASPVKKLGAAGTCSGSLPVAKVVKGDPYRLTTPARTCLYVLYDGEPYWGGIIWTRRFNRSSGMVELGCSDFWSYYDHRKIVVIPDDDPGPPDGIDDGKTAARPVSYTGMDQNDIARALIGVAHGYTNGNIGVEPELTTSGTIRTANYPGYELTDVGKALTDLANMSDGPDLMFDVAGWDAQGRPRRVLRIGNPLLTHPARGLVFEYGANLLDYTWASDGTRFANRQWATGSGSDVGTMTARADNWTRITDGWPLLEASSAYQSVTQIDTLRGHVASNLVASRLPVVTPTLTVRGDRSPRLVDMDPGDECRVIIRDDYFRSGIDTTMRIVDIAPSTENDTVQLTVNPVYEDVI